MSVKCIKMNYNAIITRKHRVIKYTENAAGNAKCKA